MNREYIVPRMKENEMRTDKDRQYTKRDNDLQDGVAKKKSWGPQWAYNNGR